MHTAERRLSQSKKKKKRREGKKKLYCSCQNFILSEFLLYKCVYVNTSHPHKDTHANTQPPKKYTPVLTHSAISPVKGVGKPVRLSQRKANLFIYLFEFRVITGITVVLGCDISLSSQVHSAPSRDVPGRKCDSFPLLISNQIK